jgi:hypothetical protein
LPPKDGGETQKTKTNSGARHLKTKESNVMDNSNKTGRLIGLSRKTKVGAMVMALAVVAAWGVVSASADKPKSKIARNSILITSIPYEDPAYDSHGNLANGSPPLPGNTLIYEDNAGFCGHRYPVTAPDGHQLTLAEWQSARGEAHAQCVQGGTLVRLKLSGLVPHGVYSIWVATFVSPGHTPDFSANIGLGALGNPDGSENHFVASADGTGELSVVHPGGTLSVFGAVSDCLLEQYEVVLFPGLHLDGQTHGGSPGDECQLSFAGSFSFKQ